MQGTATLTVPISTKTPSQLGHSLVYLPKYLDPQRTPSEREKLLQQTNLEGSTIWSRRLTEKILSKRTKIYSNIQILSKEDQKAIVFPFLDNTVWRNKDKSATFVSPIISNKAHDLAYLFTSSRTVQGITPEIDLLYTQETASNLNIDEDALKPLEPSYPICLSSPSVKNLVNLTSNLKRSYERGSAFGSLEKAHLEWMENNEIRHDRNAHNRSRKLDMYRNYIYQGSNPTQRYGLIEAFLMRKDLYPKKEEQGFFSGNWNEKFNGMIGTWGMWYKQGQQAAVDMIRKAKKTGNLDKAIPGLNSLSVLEDQTITIDWDKAIQCALRSHSIAQVLGIPPKILFLTGFAAIDVKQIILSPHLENIDKMIYVAQVVVKTLLKIIAIVGTKVLTSAMVGFGGLDTVTVPFGFNGEAFLAHHITTRVVDAIDVKFDNMKIQLDGIVDC